MPLNAIISTLKERERRNSKEFDDLEGIVLQKFERRKFDGTHSSYDIVISTSCPESESHSGLKISYIPLNNKVKISVDQAKELKILNPDELKKRILSRFGHSDRDNTNERFHIHGSVYEALKSY